MQRINSMRLGRLGHETASANLRYWYVSATAGDDANDGLTPATPWKTISRVNSAPLNPGDTVLLKRGETWAGTELVAPADGLTFDAYGAGALPVIDGLDTVNCFNPNGHDNLTIRNLEVTRGYDFGFQFNGVHGIRLINCVAHDCGNDNVIFINGTHDCLVQNLVSYNPYERAAGPRVSCLEIADGSHGIVVDTAELYGSAHAGLTIHSHPDTEYPYNLTISGVNSHDNLLFGVVLAQDNAAPNLPDNSNILITDSDFVDNGFGSGTGGQIWFTNTGDPNPAGIKFVRCRALSLSSLSNRPLYCAGQARFERCIFYADYQTLLENAKLVEFYNCVFYRTASIALTMQGSTDGVIMRNCIIESTGNVPIQIVAPATNIDIDYTLYKSALAITSNNVMVWLGASCNWANWKAITGQDAHSPTPGDPLFVNEAEFDFHLGAGSPAIDAGVVIAGVTDGYLGAAPDLGAHEKA
jgi:hypothetical protein